MGEVRAALRTVRNGNCHMLTLRCPYSMLVVRWMTRKTPKRGKHDGEGLGEQFSHMEVWQELLDKVEEKLLSSMATRPLTHRHLGQ